MPKGTYPSHRSGAIEDAPGETWGTVEGALVKGCRGLPGGSSLAMLRESLIGEGKLRDLNTRNYVERK